MQSPYPLTSRDVDQGVQCTVQVHQDYKPMCSRVQYFEKFVGDLASLTPSASDSLDLALMNTENDIKDALRVRGFRWDAANRCAHFTCMDKNIYI